MAVRKERYRTDNVFDLGIRIFPVLRWNIFLNGRLNGTTTKTNWNGMKYIIIFQNILFILLACIEKTRNRVFLPKIIILNTHSSLIWNNGMVLYSKHKVLKIKTLIWVVPAAKKGHKKWHLYSPYVHSHVTSKWEKISGF